MSQLSVIKSGILPKHLGIIVTSLVAEELQKHERTTKIFIAHLKPGEAEITMQEINRCIGKYHPHRLEYNQ